MTSDGLVAEPWHNRTPAVVGASVLALAVIGLLIVVAIAVAREFSEPAQAPLDFVEPTYSATAAQSATTATTTQTITSTSPPQTTDIDRSTDVIDRHVDDIEQRDVDRRERQPAEEGRRRRRPAERHDAATHQCDAHTQSLP